MSRKLILGTRGSELALWQANFVKNQIEQKVKDVTIELKIIKTKGDKILDVALSKIGDKGLFTKELENQLQSGGIDFAVHSLKDMETKIPSGLSISAILKRHKVNDVFISKQKNLTISKLRNGAKVATGSLRRTAQLLHMRPDLEIIDIRGNVQTRIEKYLNSDWDAIVLAAAGVERLGLRKYISSTIPRSIILSAVGQGAIAVECRSSDGELIQILKKINHKKTEIAVCSERAFLKKLQGGCQIPVAAFAQVKNNKLEIEGKVLSLDGSISFYKKEVGAINTPEKLGIQLAEELLKSGADKLLKDIFSQRRN